MKDCIRSGLDQGLLSKDEADGLLRNYDGFLAATGNPLEARKLTLEGLAGEIEHRKRIAVLAEERRVPLVAEMDTFQDGLGEVDHPLAFRLMHHSLGHVGRFAPSDTDPTRGISAEALKNAWMGRIIGLLEDGIWEFRGGFLSGDLRRSSKTVAALSGKARDVQARMANVQLEMRGVKTGDDKAASIAKVYMEVAETLRVEFNRLGGVVGKLDNWGGPQQHNREALISHGRGPWVAYMMAADMLDRTRTVHPVTGRPLTDAQLTESLGVVWDRITTDGASDREVTGAPVGRGAMHSQHADHRFLHYTPDGWLTYAQDFGNTDFHAAMLGHFAMMARDIAHMTKFGPNPERMRAYLKQYIDSQAAQVKSVAAIVAEQTAKLKALAAQQTIPNPDYEQLTDRAGEILAELAGIRRKHTPQLGGRPSKANKAALERLDAELFEIEQKLAPFLAGEAPMTLEDTAITLQMRELFDAMRDPVTFAKVGDPRGYTVSRLRFADNLWENMRGEVSAPFIVRPNVFRGWPVLDSIDITRIFDNTRNIITASSLHSAILSAISDPASGAARRQFIGMAMADHNVLKVIKETVKTWASPENRRYAARAGFTLDVSVGALHSQARMAGSVDLRRWTGFIADRVLHMQGLVAFTNAGKIAFALDAMGHFADHVGLAWPQLPEPLQRTLERGGFTPQSWDRIRAATPDEPRPGATYLRPNEIEAVAGRDLALRYQAMILTEMGYGVIDSNPTARAILHGGTQRGTVGGELARSFSQFKTFGVSYLLAHGGQIAAELGAGRKQSAAKYAATLLINGILLGAVASALKDINSGRDPKKWLDDDYLLDPNFWGAAMLQAGGLGIYGDFLFANLNRMGGSLPQTVAGPIWGRLDNLKNLTVGNAQQLLKGKETNFGAEGVRFLRENTPNVVFTKLAWERVVMDQLQLLVDKNARASWQRQASSRKKEYQQESYWPAGQVMPGRAPDLSRVVSGK